MWALVKLIENGLLQLDQDSLDSQALMALLPQVVTPPGLFKPQEIPTCCGRWRNWWRTDDSSWIRTAWPARAVTSLLPK